MNRILCFLGLHRYSLREVHVCEKFVNKVFKAVIIEKCDRCRHSRADRKKNTCIIVPDKYADNDLIRYNKMEAAITTAINFYESCSMVDYTTGNEILPKLKQAIK